MARLNSPKTARKFFKKNYRSKLAFLLLLTLFAANILNLIRCTDYSDGFEFSDNPSLSDDETTTTDDAVVTRSAGSRGNYNSSRGSYVSANVPNESSIFQKMQARLMNNSRLCEDMVRDTNNKTVTSTTAQSQHQHQQAVLKPFGFLDAINAYFLQKRVVEEKMIDSPSSSSIDQCHLPPLEVCATDTSKKYSVIVTYQPSVQVETTKPTPLRVLFMNTMSLLSYSAVTDILIVYHGSLQELQDDLKYGTRLLIWDKDRGHPVQLLVQSEQKKTELADLFSHPLFQYHPKLLTYVQQDILLFLDGTQSLFLADGSGGGERSLNFGFELSQKNSRALVGQTLLKWPTKYWRYDSHSSLAEDKATKEDELYSRIQQLEVERTLQAIPSNGEFRDPSPHGGCNTFQQERIKQATFIPYCHESHYMSTSRSTQSKNGHVFPNTTSTTMPSLPSVVRTSGIFLHRNYLCFIWHSILTPLRDFLVSIELQEKATHVETAADKLTLGSVTVSILIGQLSGSIPALYPLVKETWKTMDDLNRNMVEEQEHDSRRALLLDSKGDISIDTHRRRRRTWDLGEPQDSIQNKSVPTHRQLKLKTARGAGNEKFRSPSPDVSLLKMQSILRIIAYFGSVSRG